MGSARRQMLPAANVCRCFSPVVGALVALLIGTAVLIAACLSESRTSVIRQVSFIEGVMQQQMGNWRSKVSSAFVGLAAASQTLGGIGAANYGAFYTVARHLAGQGYVSGHVSLLEYISHAQRPAIEQRCDELWNRTNSVVQQYNSSNTANPLQLVPAPNRSHYAVYTSIFDMDDPTLSDFGCFDLLSIPLRAAAWNASATKNRLALTAPTRRLACPTSNCDKVFLVLTPIYSPVQSWRLHQSYLPYWHPPDPAYHTLLGHLVTVFDFQSELKFSTVEFAGAVALEDVTLATDGQAALAISDAEALAAPTIDGVEYNPANPLHVQAAAVRRDAGNFQNSDPNQFGRRAGTSFLYAFSNGWDSGSAGATATQITSDAFETYRASAERSWPGSTISKLIVIGGRVFAIHAAISPAAVTPVDGPVIVVAACGAAVELLVALLTYFWIRHLFKQREEAARMAAVHREKMTLAGKVHNFLMAYLSDQARNPIHGLVMTINDLRTSLLEIDSGLPAAQRLLTDSAAQTSSSTRTTTADDKTAPMQHAQHDDRQTSVADVVLGTSSIPGTAIEHPVPLATAAPSPDGCDSVAQGAGRRMRDELTNAFDGLKLLSNCTTRLATLHDDISDFSLISSGRLKVKLSVIEIVDLVQTVMASQRGFQRSAIRFSIHEACPTSIVSDLMRLQQVVSIGLSNASKHGKKRNDILLKVFPMLASFGPAVCIRIANYSNGSGTASAGFVPKAIVNAVKDSEESAASDFTDSQHQRSTSESDAASVADRSIAEKSSKNGGFGLPLAKLICVNLKCDLALYDVKGVTLESLADSSQSPVNARDLPPPQQQPVADTKASKGSASIPNRTITCFDVIVPEDANVFEGMQRRPSAASEGSEAGNNIWIDTLLSTVSGNTHLFLDDSASQPAQLPSSDVIGPSQRTAPLGGVSRGKLSPGLGVGSSIPARAASGPGQFRSTSALTLPTWHNDRNPTATSEAPATAGHWSRTPSASSVRVATAEPPVSIGRAGLLPALPRNSSSKASQPSQRAAPPLWPQSPVNVLLPTPAKGSASTKAAAGYLSGSGGATFAAAESAGRGRGSSLPRITPPGKFARPGMRIRLPGTGAALSRSENEDEPQSDSESGAGVSAGSTPPLVSAADDGDTRTVVTSGATAFHSVQSEFPAATTSRSPSDQRRSGTQPTTLGQGAVDIATGIRSTSSVTPRSPAVTLAGEPAHDQSLPGSVLSNVAALARHEGAPVAEPTVHEHPSSAMPPAQAADGASGRESGAGGKRNLGLRVLYADDDAVNRKLMTRAMQSAGCSITTVEDGDEVEAAIDADTAESAVASRRPFDVILLDIVMKRMGGDVVCRKLVHERKIAQPVIAVTGNARDVAQLKSAGFLEIVEKPFKAADLIAVITKHVGARL